MSLSVRASLEITGSGDDILNLLPAALALVLGSAALGALKSAVDGPAEFSPPSGSLSGRVIVITGGSAGLGFETAVRLARAGATVVATARNADKARAAQEALRKATGGADVHVLTLDLADLASIRSFVDVYRQQPYGSRVDVLVNNAGVMAVPERLETSDGFELQLGVNHLGHFALTGLLLPLLTRSSNYARVISVSSLAHKIADPAALQSSFDGDSASQSSYSAWPVYSLSKLANVVFAKELNRRFLSAGVKATAVSLHPGLCATDLARYVVSGKDKPMKDIYAGFPPPVQGLMEALKGGLRPISRGANSHVFLAAGADGGYDCSGGKYFEDMRPVEAHPRASDPLLGDRLWRQSEKLTGVQYDFTTAGSPAGEETVSDVSDVLLKSGTTQPL